MRSPFQNVSDEQWSKLAEDQRSIQFLAGARLPLMWQVKARQHKRSADIIYEVAREANSREMSRFVEETRSGTATGFRTIEGQEREDLLDQHLIFEYYLLIGYALECLLKGYLLAILPELVKRRLDSVIVTHDLTELCRDANMVVSDEEKQLLDFLTQCIYWQSKYPVPLKLAASPSPLAPPELPQKVRTPFNSGLKVALDEMCVRASIQLEAERQRLVLSK